MRVAIKRVHSPDVADIFSYLPNGPFCILLQFLIGPEGGAGEESFDVTICSPSWLEEQADLVISGSDTLIVKEFSANAAIEYMERFVASLTGNTWRELAQRIDRVAKWEFRDFDLSLK